MIYRKVGRIAFSDTVSVIISCKYSVGGTDYKNLEPAPFAFKWYAHTFRGADLSYEIGIYKHGGWFVWVITYFHKEDNLTSDDFNQKWWNLGMNVS